jgi:Arm DNA-binding domain
MGRRSLSGGVVPMGTTRIQFDFSIDRTRFRPTLPWVSTEANLWRARAHVASAKFLLKMFHMATFPEQARSTAKPGSAGRHEETVRDS